jgi:hypothetical protein
MVKLLRLTSNDNCKFSVNMDADLIVDEQSQIAVKNLTFETEFEVLSVSGYANPVLSTNGSIQFGADTNIYGEATALLDAKQYNNSNFLTFFTDMDRTLNNTLEPIQQDEDESPTTEGQQFYAQYKIDPDDDLKAIKFRLSPVIVPLITRDLQTIDIADWSRTTEFMSNSYDNATNNANIEVNTKAVPQYAGDMALVSKVGGVTGDNVRNAYFVCNNPSTQWCKGSSVFWARINGLTDNTGASDTNGMEIGLSTYQGQDTDVSIPDSEIYFSIRVKKPTDDIEFIVPQADFKPGGTPVGSTGNTPTNPVKANTAEQDILFIQRERVNSGLGNIHTRIRGYIFRDGQVPLLIFSHSLTKEHQDVPLYPFICMYGADANAKMSQPSITFDPFEIDLKFENAYIDLIKPRYANRFAGVSTFAEILAAYNTPAEVFIPNLKDLWYAGQYGLTAVTQLNIDRSILKFMGFPNSIAGDGTGRHIFQPTISTTVVPYGFTLTPINVFQATTSDNYVVVIDSNKVISYDCSQTNTANADVVGKRMNIIATIPVSDSSGAVEFQANEVQYIDMDNKAPTAIRNLKLRVLDKSLQEITTNGMSVMTLLIKD